MTAQDDIPEPIGLWQCISANEIKEVARILDENPGAVHVPVRWCDQFLDGDKAVHIAARRGDAAIVRLLLDRGAELNELNTKYGSTPLIAAVQASQPEVIALLGEKGADLNVVDKLGKTALHLCADSWRKGAVAKALLALGADTEVKDKKGNTPLIMAITVAGPHTALALVEHGANFNATDEFGVTAFELAQKKAAKDSEYRPVFVRMTEILAAEEYATYEALLSDIYHATHDNVDMAGKLMPQLKLARKPARKGRAP